MKPIDFDYVRPATLADAVALLARAAGNAKLMAGGQTLGPMLNLRFVQPEQVIDISRLAELKRVEGHAGSLRIGACVTHAAIEDGHVPDVTHGMLARIAARIAYRAVRTRGTIGGSLAHADPAADWVSTLSALGCSISLIGPNGRRDVPMEQFVRGALETALLEGEMIEAIVLQGLSPDARWGYHKICRKTGEFAEAIGAVVIDRERVRIVAGATAGRPIVLDLPAADVLGRPIAGLDVSARLTAAGLTADNYRMKLHSAAIRRALEEALAA